MAKKDEKWLKILGKGMLTLPKKWRDGSGLQSGDVVKAKKEAGKVIIDLQEQSKETPYRIYTDAQIDQFLKEDKITDKLSAKVESKLSASKSR